LEEVKMPMITKRIRTDRVDPFFHTQAWRQLRAAYIIKHGERCQGLEHDPRQPRSGEAVRLELDHIIERQDWPQGALVWENLILLCRACHGKKTVAMNIARREHEHYTRLAARKDPTISIMPKDVARSFVELQRRLLIDRLKRKAAIDAMPEGKA
jgi:hypothetical protein